MSTIARLIEYKHTSAIGRTMNAALGSALGSMGADGVEGSIDIKDINKNVTLAPKGTGIIDVVNDFNWNANYINASYEKIPKVYITEREQQESSIVAAYYYYISNILNLGSRINATGNVSSTIDYLTTQAQTFIDRGAKAIEGITPNVTAPEQTGKTSGAFMKFIQTVGADFGSLAAADSVLLGEYLKSYTGIYLTRETGFNYVLPYFTDSWQNISNQWTTIGAGSNMSSAGLDFIDNISESTLQLVKPGVYIERPQYFSFDQSGDAFEVTFPLLNTVSESYKKNYELLWILAFQNKYYRESFASVRPPKIYTVSIPGVKYMPYAHIESLSINFAGTRRILEVDTPRGSVRAPIPDAYVVTIRFKSLLSDSANMMLTNQFHRSILTGVRNTR